MKFPKNKSHICFLLAIIMFSISFFKIVNVNSQIKLLGSKIIPYVYIDEYEASGEDIETVNYKLNQMANSILSKHITIVVNNEKYELGLKDIGITTNKDGINESIKEYVDETDYWDLYNSYSKDNFDTKRYNLEYVIDDEKIIKFLNKLKQKVDKAPGTGRLALDDNHQLVFVTDEPGYDLKIEENLQLIKENFKNNNYNPTLTLEGDVLTDKENPLSLINTKISSFTTTFDDTLYRKYNLIAGASYINGTILEPGEVFSFYNVAGPYTKSGYVYYLGMMGNGVCQVATTLYNAELLAGLTTITRYNHGEKSVYVDGGLDATVSTSKTFIADFKFKNTLDYPVYISAFVEGGNLTIEFWSHENALGGKTYKLESVRHGYGSYSAYRHIYQDGEYVDTENLGSSWYYKE